MAYSHGRRFGLKCAGDRYKPKSDDKWQETSLVICRHFADPPLDVSIAPVNWASNFFFLLLMTKTGPSPPYSTPLLTVVWQVYDICNGIRHITVPGI